ncbi:sulfatase family protein [Actinomadura rupiterrae]|uniref:sulfatase family protein n=1 Tax=Actinomadura rupiterrae TaxID=559627 RepID=UPI0020A4937C|nr:sulfatase [Actinomadura rupiterrae]MCP2338698.1 arylsulfatase A-like enzyme [Actinomadura rupiterrae]
MKLLSVYRRRPALPSVLLALVLLAGAVSAGPRLKGPSASAATTGRPNIVFILTDDLNEDVFAKDDGLQSLLTSQGTTFTKQFVELSLCCPSRTSTLRGQCAHNTGIFTNDAATGGGFQSVYNKGLESSTVATWLQDAGYRTALFGKYLNGYPNGAPSSTYIPPGWTRWFSPNGGSPYSEYNYDVNDNGTTVHYGSTAADYGVDVISNKLSAFIKNTTTTYPDKPFFTYVAPFIPHGPATPPPRYDGIYPNAKAPRTPSFNEADVSDKPAWIRDKPLLDQTQITNIDNLYERRRESLRSVTDLLQNTINTLQAQGVLNNTYIVFTSDNGFHQGQHRLNSGKNTAYEEDLNVPLVIRGPGVPAGATVNAFTLNTDFAPTFAQLAGVTPPDFVDGRSLVPFLKGVTPTPWRLAFLNEHAGPSTLNTNTQTNLLEPQDPGDAQALATGGAPVYASLRAKPNTLGIADPLNYVAYDTGEHELYDLTTDPYQLNNSYGSASATLKRRLDAWVDTLKTASGQALRTAEENPPQ